MKSLIQEVVSCAEDWEQKLQAEPYCLEIRRRDDFAIFNYKSFASDLSLPIVQEARGIILDVKSKTVACWPFNKFFNIYDPNAATLDWGSARVQEKMDGSIIKAWFCWKENRWVVSTNKGIWAHEVSLYNSFQECFLTYGDLFDEAVGSLGFDLYPRLSKNCTYMFELVSPIARIVIEYPETSIYHTGTRDLATGDELDADIGVKKPREYRFADSREAIQAVKELGADHEGFVLVDKNWNRLKVKTESYVEMHTAFMHGRFGEAEALDMIIAGTDDDFRSIFNNYEPVFESVYANLRALESDFKRQLEAFGDLRGMTKKEAALLVVGNAYETLLFGYINHKFELEHFREYLFSQRMNIVRRVMKAARGTATE
ncbi:MAG: hypothetical protein LBT59_11215 [Clostridiales bacterium]|jgi:hypothetical protein|nr:hypothetical protein [Clostridiales bacterium]